MSILGIKWPDLTGGFLTFPQRNHAKRGKTVVELHRLLSCVSAFILAWCFTKFQFSLPVTLQSQWALLSPGIGNTEDKSASQGHSLPSIDLSLHILTLLLSITELIGLLSQAFPKINVSFLEKPGWLWIVSIWPTVWNEKKKKTLQICGDVPGFRHQKKGRAFETGQVGTQTVTRRGQTTQPWMQNTDEMMGSLSPKIVRSYSVPQTD